MASPLTEKHRGDLIALRAATLRDLLPMWENWNPEDKSSWERFARPAASLIAARHTLASNLGAAYYKQLRATQLGNAGRPVKVVPPLDPEMVYTSLAQSGLVGTLVAKKAGKDMDTAKLNGFVRMQAAAGRHVMNGARDTVVRATFADPSVSGFYRRSSGTCDFCAELVAEGSNPGAEFVAHDGCACVGEPAFSGIDPENVPTFVDVDELGLDGAAKWGLENLQPQAALTASELVSVDKYCSSTFELLNPYLRGLEAPGEITAERVAELTTDLDAAIAKSQLREGIVTWRGVANDLGAELDVGSTFVDNAYVSSSLDSSIAGTFGEEGWTMRLEIPAGRNGLYIDEKFDKAGTVLINNRFQAGEMEVVLGRGSKFEVTQIDREERRIYARLK